MRVHEIQFPTGVSWESQGGVGFAVHVSEGDSGQEERVLVRSQGRMRFNAKEQVKKYFQLVEIGTFHRARKGKTHGFRFKDWLDYNSTSLGRSWGQSDDAGATPSFLDQVIGTGDGATQVFQLVKRYTDAAGTDIRTIKKPVVGTVRVAVNGSEVFAFVCDYTTGRITFSVAPAADAVITAGFEFDVPVRFGDGVEEALSVTARDFGRGDMPDIPLIEILDDELYPEDRLFGGSKLVNIGSAVGVTLDITSLLWVVNPGASGKKAYLPDLLGLPKGGPLLAVVNSDPTNALAIERLTAPGSGTYTSYISLSAGQTAEFFHGESAPGSSIWLRF